MVEKRKKPVPRRAESVLAGAWADEDPDISHWEIDDNLFIEPEPYANPFFQAEKEWRGE